ncbi:uncharacterized protein [Amphiura filiformis]|uniref:uncharacterized protein n=1 Tax=Amphiura filiformis TaxID=82378 RepID=UPI003B218975
MMGLLLILAIVGLAQFGSGYAQDVYVTCEVRNPTSYRKSKVFTAPADTLAFKKEFSYYKEILSIAVEESNSCIYFNYLVGKSVEKYAEPQGEEEQAVQKVIAHTDNVDHVESDGSGTTLYYFDDNGDAYSLDLTSTSASGQLIASTGRVCSTSIVGNDMYMTTYPSEGDHVIKHLDLTPSESGGTFQLTEITSARKIDGLVYDDTENALFFAWNPDSESQEICRRDLGTGIETKVYRWSSQYGYSATSIDLYNGGLLFTDRRRGLYTLPKDDINAQPTAIGTGLDDCKTFHEVEVVTDVTHENPDEGEGEEI